MSSGAYVPPPPTYPPPAPYSTTPPYPTYAPAMRPRTQKPTIAGVLLLIAGILAAINYAYMLVTTSETAGEVAPYLPDIDVNTLRNILIVCGAIGLIFCLFAIIGGIMALQRRMWALALVGSILGLLTIGFVGEASILSLIALVLIAMSKAEFA